LIQLKRLDGQSRFRVPDYRLTKTSQDHDVHFTS
jgi:hypothetical protein